MRSRPASAACLSSLCRCAWPTAWSRHACRLAICHCEAALWHPLASSGSGGDHPWVRHGTVLTNQAFPVNAVALIPTIEILNGPTNDSLVKIDWWLFAQSRYSLRDLT